LKWFAWWIETILFAFLQNPVPGTNATTAKDLRLVAKKIAEEKEENESNQHPQQRANCAERIGDRNPKQFCAPRKEC
jgi:hypothetical protein